MAGKSIPLKSCQYDGCIRPLYSRNPPLCHTHYKNQKRQAAKVASRQALSAYFFTRFTKSDDSDACWAWNGPREKQGYGAFELQYHHYKAHQVSFFLHNGRWAENEVLHSCDKRDCVNPRHLREGTHSENMQDARDRDRFAKGSKSSNSKLEESDVRVIKQRLQDGDRIAILAREYSVTYMAIYDINRGRCWSHL